MNRRTACRTTAAGLLVGLAGCLGDENDDSPEESTDDPQPDDDPTDTDMTDDETDEPTDPTDRIDSDRVAGATFSHTGNCSDPETASVEFLDSEVEALISGCIEGRNGCAVPVLVDGSEEDGTLRVEIGEVDFSDDDTLCTQEITRLSYELRLRFDPEAPETIDVFHDGAIEQGVVATATRP